MTGWIKLHRELTHWGWYQDSKTKAVFIHLLLGANHKAGSWQGVEVPRGAIVSGRKSLSLALGLSEQEIRTAIQKLKSTNDITIKATNHYSLITVVNYDSYQGEDTESNQPINQPPNQRATSKQPTINHKQEGKNEKNIKKKEILSNLFKQGIIDEHKTQLLQSWYEYRVAKDKSRPAWSTERGLRVLIGRLDKGTAGAKDNVGWANLSEAIDYTSYKNWQDFYLPERLNVVTKRTWEPKV